MRKSRGSIRNRHSRRKLTEGFELQLTSLMDALVIILIFLLKNYSSSSVQFSTVAGIQLPVSLGKDVPPQSLQVIVTPEGMTFDSERIIDFVQTPGTLESGETSYKLKATDLDEGGTRIIPLYDALVKARDKSELLRSKSQARDLKGNPLPFEGVLAIQADKRIEYDTLKKSCTRQALLAIGSFDSWRCHEMAANVTFRSEHKCLLVIPCETQLNILAHAQLGELFIGSQCGGHGKCGKDLIQISQESWAYVSEITDAEKKHLTADQLARGFRLGCQSWLNSAVKPIQVEVLHPDRRGDTL